MPNDGAPTRVCPRCSTLTAAHGAFCPHCGAGYTRPRPPRMSRRAKVVRRLVPTLLVLIGGVAAGIAIAASPGSSGDATADVPAKPVPVAKRSAPAAAPAPHVEINSQTQTDTQQVQAQMANVAQMVAAVTSVDQAPDTVTETTTAADESTTPIETGPVSVPEPTTPPDGGDISLAKDPPADDLNADGCSDSYDGACVDPYSGVDDVNCSDIDETDFDSVGDDPYGLDRDADGIACESYT